MCVGFGLGEEREGNAREEKHNVIISLEKFLGCKGLYIAWSVGQPGLDVLGACVHAWF